MSDKAPRPKDVVTLDTETILQTTEGRRYINQINSVSTILTLKGSEVTFKGEEIARIGIVADCKSVQLFKCPRGYFIFCNKALTMNNWSAAGAVLEDLLNKLYDPQIKEKIVEQLKETSEAS